MYQALADFDYKIRKFLRARMDSIGADVDISDLELLLACKYRAQIGPLCLSDLRKIIHASDARFMRLVRRAVDRKWLERRKSRGFRNGSFLWLTDKGEALLAEFAQHDREYLRSACGDLIQHIHILTGTRSGKVRCA